MKGGLLVHVEEVVTCGFVQQWINLKLDLSYLKNIDESVWEKCLLKRYKYYVCVLFYEPIREWLIIEKKRL